MDDVEIESVSVDCSRDQDKMGNKIPVVTEAIGWITTVQALVYIL